VVQRAQVDVVLSRDLIANVPRLHNVGGIAITVISTNAEILVDLEIGTIHVDRWVQKSKFVKGEAELIIYLVADIARLDSVIFSAGIWAGGLEKGGSSNCSFDAGRKNEHIDSVLEEQGIHRWMGFLQDQYWQKSGFMCGAK